MDTDDIIGLLSAIYAIVTATVAKTRSNSKALGLVWSATISLLLLNSLLNPFLYCWKMKEVSEGHNQTVGLPIKLKV